MPLKDETASRIAELLLQIKANTIHEIDFVGDGLSTTKLKTLVTLVRKHLEIKRANLGYQEKWLSKDDQTCFKEWPKVLTSIEKNN